eukprot:CAMPEP_0184644926 /NCGR_PEP_ID=MMETSP0308-20130426/1523_1 /TAXON_ID=38269 /ORGANISM="Gloeochaete witrockiana, Strain SAG 46.84" /LENGTH=69 /DNA_ID=CAMNT_0027073669 /DNA_START=477 /DNA_END=687 /DNA_ORIENTATION=-
MVIGSGETRHGLGGGSLEDTVFAEGEEEGAKWPTSSSLWWRVVPEELRTCENADVVGSNADTVFEVGED